MSITVQSVQLKINSVIEELKRCYACYSLSGLTQEGCWNIQEQVGPLEFSWVTS